MVLVLRQKKSIPSAVTGLYNSIFDKIVSVYSNDKTVELEETLNQKLGAHSMKKGVCQSLADSGCNPLAIIFRYVIYYSCSYSTAYIHFSYIFLLFLFLLLVAWVGNYGLFTVF